MPLERIAPTKRKSLQVAEKLLEEIHQGSITLGSHLPPERQLTEQFGVSRTVVREALSALQMLGIVEPRVGDGTYVVATAVNRVTNPSPLLENLAASVSIMEALKAREALDISVAHLAIENSNLEDLAELDRLVDEMRLAIEREEFSRYIRLTLDFHLAIAKMAGNTILEQVVSSLIEVIRPHLWVIEQNYSQAVAEQSLRIHAAILESIRRKDMEGVIEHVRKHYQDYPSLQR